MQFDPLALLQLGPLAVVLLFVIIRLERAMGNLAGAVRQINMVLLLLLRKSGIADDDALHLLSGGSPADPESCGGK